MNFVFDGLNEFIFLKTPFLCRSKSLGAPFTELVIMFLISQSVLRVAIMESSNTSVFLGISRDKLSVWQIFLDVRNSILKLLFKRIVPQRSSLFAV